MDIGYPGIMTLIRIRWLKVEIVEYFGIRGAKLSTSCEIVYEMKFVLEVSCIVAITLNIEISSAG
jgi:hypothetical protein